MDNDPICPRNVAMDLANFTPAVDSPEMILFHFTSREGVIQKDSNYE